MSDNKDNKKKGFFSRLFGGSSTPKDATKEQKITQELKELPSKSALNKMKKADIVSSAKDNGLDLDINLTKAQLLEAWEIHFSSDSSEDVSADKITPVQEASAEEEAPVEEEAPAEEEEFEEKDSSKDESK